MDITQLKTSRCIQIFLSNVFIFFLFFSLFSDQICSKKTSQPPPGGLLDSISNIFGCVDLKFSVLCRVYAGLCRVWTVHVVLHYLSLSVCLSAACLSVFRLDSSNHTPGEGLCECVCEPALSCV